MFIYFATLLLSLSVNATVFQVQGLDQQIREADGIVIGHFLHSKSIKLDDGSVATQMFFKMNEEYGMQSDFFGMDEVIVHYPGGKLDGMHVKVDGVPEFVPGENVVLMIKSLKDRYWGLNLGFGTFRVVNYGKDKLIVNSIFPDDVRTSLIPFEALKKSVRDIKGTRLKQVVHHEYQTNPEAYGRMPASVEGAKNRSIASKNEEGENNSGTELSNFWLIAFLAFAGGAFRFSRRAEPK